MRVGVIGGGIAGLTCAYELAKQGAAVTVFEKEREPGGQLRTFMVGGQRLEGFYHHLFASDAELVGLLRELGLAPYLRWLPSRVGYFYGDKVYPFVTPLDLLRFSALSFVGRLKVGLVSLYLQRHRSGHNLEGVTARQWLRQHLGQRSFEVVWEPLLRGKFGDYAGEISMAWLWSKVRLRVGSRSFGMQREKLGYVEGSFYRVIEALIAAIKGLGGDIRLSHPVERIMTNGGVVRGVEVAGTGFPLDRVVAAIPSPAFLTLAPDLAGEYRDRLEAIPYLAALVLVLVVRHPVTSVYWLNIGDPAIPFVAAIEHTNLMPPSLYEGKRLLYLGNYLPASSPLYRMSAEELLDCYLPHLRRINPEFAPEWIEEYHCFRDKAGQPVVGTNYLAKMPPHHTPVAGLYLMNATQIYPEDRGMNYSVRLGRKVARLVGEGKGRPSD